MNRYIRLVDTVKYLKFIQIFYRLYYFGRSRYRRQTKHKYLMASESQAKVLILQSSIVSNISYKNITFTFLNLSHRFEDNINWNYSEYGKLWTYNLTYFDYLNQKEMSKEDSVRLIYNFIDQSGGIKDGQESFTISLRGINWIKFLSKHKIEDQKINYSLYAQYFILIDNIEYHILGNHLLENGFSLLYGAYYFQDETLYAKAKNILIDELEEQILDDGAHFELSPMYHQIMLFRVLDCINLIQNNNWKNHELLDLLISKSEIMLRWLNAITYENGDIPLLNDSTNKIAPTTKQLNDYADILKITNYHQLLTMKHQLGESGYRKRNNERYEMIMDVGNIGPDYIPGHAHSDTFNFELYVEEKPFIVDTGLSTYEANARRTLERSTASHNTVEINGIDQSEVWGGFRVANRAYVVDLDERYDYIKATHDGYKKRLDVLHQREFLFEDKKIKIIDTIISEIEHNAIARLHFHPGVEPIIINDGLQIDNIKIKIDQRKSSSGENSKFKIKEYSYAPEFNKLIKANMLEIPFTKKLEIEIIL